MSAYMQPPTSLGPQRNTTSVWGSGPADVWAVGYQDANLLHFDGTQWEVDMSLPGTPQFLRGVHGSAANDVWVVGDRSVYHYDGTTWTDSSPITNTPFYPYAIWMPAGDANGTIWTVGGQGILKGTR